MPEWNIEVVMMLYWFAWGYCYRHGGYNAGQSWSSGPRGSVIWSGASLSDGYYCGRPENM